MLDCPEKELIRSKLVNMTDFNFLSSQLFIHEQTLIFTLQCLIKFVLALYIYQCNRTDCQRFPLLLCQNLIRVYCNYRPVLAVRCTVLVLSLVIRFWDTKSFCIISLSGIIRHTEPMPVPTFGLCNTLRKNVIIMWTLHTQWTFGIWWEISTFIQWFFSEGEQKVKIRGQPSHRAVSKWVCNNLSAPALSQTVGSIS